MARQPLDLYATPPDVASAVVKRVHEEHGRPGCIIEPSAGPGRFVVAARARWRGITVDAVDIDGAHREACIAAGAASFRTDDWRAAAARFAAARVRSPELFLPAPLLILGNPPYNQAQAHVEASLEMLRPGERLVFLLRHSFHGAEERIEFFERNPEEWSAIVLPRVPYLDDGGGDSADACVFCWQKGYRGPSRRAHPILWGSALAKREAARAQLDLIGRAG
jgi:hypothetical protein